MINNIIEYKVSLRVLKKFYALLVIVSINLIILVFLNFDIIEGKIKDIKQC